MLLFVRWRHQYSILEWPKFNEPTSTHNVFTLFSLSQYCWLHFWRSKFGSILAQGFLMIKGQVQITKCYFLWVGAINVQSLSVKNLMRQQVPMVISLHSIGSMIQFMSVLLFAFLTKLLWVHVSKRMFTVQRSNHKMLVFRGLVQAISENAIFEWPLYEALTGTNGVFTSLTLS